MSAKLLDINAEDLPWTKKIDAYIESNKNRWSKATLTSVRSRLNLIASLFNGLEDSVITPDALYNALVETNLSAYSRKTTMIVYAGFEEAIYYTKRVKTFLSRNGFLFRNAYKEKTKNLKMDQITTALTEVKNVPDIYNFIVLCGLAGLRKHEAFKAKWSDISQQESLLTVVGKGGKQRQVPLDPSILMGYETRSSSSTDPESRIIRSAYTKAISDRWPPSLTGFTPHDLRAAYITHLVNSPGVGVKDVSQAVGHSSIATTSRYIRADVSKILNPIKEVMKNESTR